LGETTLFRVTWNHKSQEVDFGVYPEIDRYLKNELYRNEIIEMLETLTERMKNNEYPFKR
jgi:hypothetical protein